MMKKEQYLDNQLIEYSKSDFYPFHMPGHKRQPLGEWLPEEIDITEIEGFDNLHHAEGVLRDGQQRLAKLCGADESFYLVNGSTSGLLSAISGVTKKGDRILIARNCHKAVYHAIYLLELKVEYLYPEPTSFGIQGQISPEQIREKLSTIPDIRAVVITSPTYDGIVSDIQTISEIVHEKNIPLIVDEAHGAHFGFSNGFPQKAIALGADLCIESFHKTLPCFTQTAVLHMKKTAICCEDGNDKTDAYRFDRDRVKRYLGIYQTSSPSYLFMASIDRCVRLIGVDLEKYAMGQGLFAAFEKQLQGFYEACEKLQYVDVFPWSDMTEADVAETDMAEADVACLKDNSKILISAERAGLNGQELNDLLRENYHLEMEMASGHYVTAITTFMDTEEGWSRLLDALQEIDAAAGMNSQKVSVTEGPDAATEQERITPEELYQPWEKKQERITPEELYQPREKKLELAEAMDAEAEVVELSMTAGCVSAEFIYLYPPGIPMVTPGEVMDEQVLKVLQTCQKRNMQIEGMSDLSGKTLRVIKYNPA